MTPRPPKSVVLAMMTGCNVHFFLQTITTKKWSTVAKAGFDAICLPPGITLPALSLCPSPGDDFLGSKSLLYNSALRKQYLWKHKPLPRNVCNAIGPVFSQKSPKDWNTPSNMPESCLGTAISAIKYIPIMMFYIVYKGSAKCVAACCCWWWDKGWRKLIYIPLQASSLALLPREAEVLFF